MKLRVFISILTLPISTSLFPCPNATAQDSPNSDDPLRHGHALLIGITNYQDRHWPFLGDISIQVKALRDGLRPHFDTVDVVSDLTSAQLRDSILDFLSNYENERNSRLLIYYAGHGYTAAISQYNELRGYITGIDTPHVDGTSVSFNSARSKSISMITIRSMLEDSVAHSILFVFDSCFAGTIFLTRGDSELIPLSKERVDQLLQSPARDFLTAGTANQTVPAHSPLPELFLDAIRGDADSLGLGVVSPNEIRDFLLKNIRGFDLTPQEGRLYGPAFAGGEFLFRVINPVTSNSTAPLVSQDDANSRYREAADKGDANAQVQLAYLYANGQAGLPKDDREAARLYKLAADQENAIGQYNLGIFYDNGRGGLTKDDREAARLFKLAADQGAAPAQANLGVFYENGRGGVPKDDRQAARLYKLAADQGLAWAQKALTRLTSVSPPNPSPPIAPSSAPVILPSPAIAPSPSPRLTATIQTEPLTPQDIATKIDIWRSVDGQMDEFARSLNAGYELLEKWPSLSTTDLANKLQEASVKMSAANDGLYNLRASYSNYKDIFDALNPG